MLKTKEIEAETSLVGVNGGSGYRNLVQGVCRARLNTGEEEVQVILGGMLYDLHHLSSHFIIDDGEPIKIAALIGGEFMEHYNAKIDYKKRTLTIDDVEGKSKKRIGIKTKERPSA